MAGPAADVLLPTGDVDERRQEIRRLLKQTASHWDGDDFRVEERPFRVGFGEEYPGELDEMAASGLAAALGWLPVDPCCIAAMCNAQVDHRLLAEMCGRIASACDGVIAFGGSLRGWSTLPEDRAIHAVDVSVPEGRLIATNYLTVSERYATSHVGDFDFLRYWIHHPDFRSSPHGRHALGVRPALLVFARALAAHKVRQQAKGR